MVRVQQVIIVLANWCPHCVPLSLENAKRISKDLGVPLRVLDIDVPEQENVADRLVEQYGDFVEDYIIPQIFLEYEGGKVEHIFTGFQEKVSITKVRWVDLFKSEFYQSLLVAQNESLTAFTEKYLVFNISCRHCEAPAFFRPLLIEQNFLVGAYCCPSGLVSKAVCFGLELNLEKKFYAFLIDQLGKEAVSKRDLRVATRHGWELGEGATEYLQRLALVQRKNVITEVYWTRYPMADDDKNKGVFLCSDPESGKGCRRLFVKDLNSMERLCHQCR